MNSNIKLLGIIIFDSVNNHQHSEGYHTGSVDTSTGFDGMDTSIVILGWWKNADFFAYLVHESDVTKLGGNGDHFVDERRTINMVPKDVEVKNHGVPTAKVSLEIDSLRKIGSRTVL